MTTIVGPASDLEGFNQRIVERLSAFINSHNCVIARHFEIRTIQQIRDREKALRSDLLAHSLEMMF